MPRRPLPVPLRMPWYLWEFALRLYPSHLRVCGRWPQEKELDTVQKQIRILTDTMFNRTNSTKIFAPRLRQRTDQPLAERRRKDFLTADSRKFTQTRIRTFHRRDAEYAEGRIFAQSGDDDWAKELLFRRGMFLFVVVSRQTKKAISLRPLRLCGYILKEFLLSPNLACFASLRLAPWNTNTTEVDLMARSAIPQGESSFIFG